MHREDDFSIRRAHLAALSEEELKERFWSLASQVVEPLLELARTNTSPSIERSVLMRMGFSSIEAKGIVEKCVAYQLLGKGAGNIVWRTAQMTNLPLLEAGRALAEGEHWEQVKKYFVGGENVG